MVVVNWLGCNSYKQLADSTLESVLAKNLILEHGWDCTAKYKMLTPLVFKVLFPLKIEDLIQTKRF